MSKIKPIDPTSALLKPYLQELRDKYPHDVYEIDPYVEVFHIRENIYALFIPAPHSVGDNWVYLIDGPQKALCIDNGFGIGNLKGLCEMLTKKEVLTAVTHFHGGHAGGSSQWNEVYCHDFCAEALEKQLAGDMKEWWRKFNHVGLPDHRYFYKEEDVIPFTPYKALHLKNHAIINLGEDYDIELIHMAGHSTDSVAYLDKKTRILFSGDALFESRIKGLGVSIHSARKGTIHPECAGIIYYSKRLQELCDRIDEFDYVMAGHGYLDSPAKVALDVNKAVKAVMADPNCYDTTVQRHRGGVDGTATGSGVDVLPDTPSVIIDQQNLTNDAANNGNAGVAAGGAGPFCVQFGNFSAKEGADALSNELTGKGIYSYVYESGGNYKVLGLPYPNKDKAKEAAAIVSAAVSDAFVVDLSTLVP